MVSLPPPPIKKSFPRWPLPEATFSAPGCCVLHRIALPMVSEWYQYHPHIRLTPSLTGSQSRRAFGVELTPFGAVRASSTIHVRPLGGSPPPSVALLVHQLREGLAPLWQRQASALRRRGRVAHREHRPHHLGLRYPEDLLGLFPALPLQPAYRGDYPVRSGRERDPLREPPLVEGLLLKELRLPSHHQHDTDRSVGQVGGAALTGSQAFERRAVADHHELPRLAVARAT